MSYLIALDDGHGMSTAGKRTPYIPSLGRFVHENEFNRAVVGYLERELKRCGFRTLMTAPGDEDVSLADRTAAANAARADLLISVHYNAMGSTMRQSGARGVAVFIQPGNYTGKDKAKQIARYVLDAVKSETGAEQYNAGVIEQDLHMTRVSNMTAILSENGFMDFESDAFRMVNPEYQKAVARAHAKAVCKFFGVSFIPEPPVVAVAVNLGVVNPQPPVPPNPGRPLNPSVAQNIIDSFLDPGWYAATAAGNHTSADWIHFCANEIRAAAGLPQT